MFRHVASANEMSVLAQELVGLFSFPEVMYLHGELGAGKTTLVREILHTLGHTGAVKSPTYTLYESYSLSATAESHARVAHHFDLYRLTSPDELEYIGIRDLLDADLILVEWPDRGGEYLPPATISIDIRYASTGGSETRSGGQDADRATENIGRDIIITRAE